MIPGSRAPKYKRMIKPIAVVTVGVMALAYAPLLSGQRPVLSTTESTGLERHSLGKRTSNNVQSAKITLDAKDITRIDALRRLAKLGGVSISWSDAQELLSGKIDVALKNVDLKAAIQEVLNGSGTVPQYLSGGQKIVIVKDTSEKSPGKKGGTISGKVIDSATKKPISGVSITVVGLKLNQLTDVNGIFELHNVPEGKQTVSAKALGYRSVSRDISVSNGERQNVSFSFVATATSLSEVITTATGQRRRVEVAHDIAKIDAEAVMQRSPVRSVSDLLEAAQVPGVLVQRQSGDPGSPTKIRIRGISSISQSNDPVVILDGVWIDGSLGKPSRIDDIDPSTIESIEIVRGPSAATLYGQDASNGIIVITSKKGNIGKARWNMQYSRDWGETYGKKPLMYIGQGLTRTLLTARRCDIEDILRYTCTQDSVDVYDPNNKLLSQEGVETNNRFVLQLDGGVNSIQYAISANFQDQTGVRQNSPVDLIRARLLGHSIDNIFLKPSALSRKSLSSSLTINPSNNLTIGFNVSGTQSDLKDNQYGMRFSGSDYQYINQWSLDTTDIELSTYTSTKNPVKSTSVVMGSNMNWRPTSSYVVNATLGLERFNGTDNKTQSQTSTGASSNPAQDVTTTMKQDNKAIYTARINASTSLKLGALDKFLSIRPSIGGDYRKTDQNSFTFEQKKIPSGESGIIGGENSSATYSKLANATAGWYINSAFGIFQRLYFDLGVRQDIGSAITSSGNTKYPKLGSSWLISDESFWPQNSIVSLLRLRGAIGHSAVQPDLTDIYGRYLNGYAYVNGQFVNSFDQDQAGNPKLNPERATEIEIGFDTDLIYDRVNLIVTYARSENKNSLINRTLPASIGIGGIGGGSTTRKENIARVFNANLELAATIKALEMREHQLTVNYSLTLSNNRVRRLGEGVSPFHSNSVSRVQEGYPLAGVWGQVVMGYIDSNQDGLISDEEMVKSDSMAFLGWSQPRIKASYGLSWTIRNSITLDSRFAYQGNYIQSLSTRDSYGLASQNASLSEQVIAKANMIGKRNISDLRWNSASISYFLPASLLTKFKARSVNLSLQASNLALWTSYVGRDPGVNSSLLYGEGISDDGATTPRPRLYVFTLRWGL